LFVAIRDSDNDNRQRNSKEETRTWIGTMIRTWTLIGKKESFRTGRRKGIGRERGRGRREIRKRERKREREKKGRGTGR